MPLALFVFISFAQVRPGDRRLPARSRTVAPKAPVTKDEKKDTKTDVKTTNATVTPIQSNMILTPGQLQQIQNFKPIKIGTLTGNKGAKELTVVDNRFPEENNSKLTKVKEERKENMMCVTDRLKVDVKTRDFLAFTNGGVPDWLKPGIMLEASSFVQGGYVIEESVPRAPIILSTSLRGVPNTFLEVKNPAERHLITQAESRLISQKANKPSALMNFTFHEIRSAEELELKLTGQLNSAIGNLSSTIGLNYGTKKEHNYYMVEFHQTMFSIEVNGLKENQIFLKEAKNAENLIYLSKVNYGRRGFIMFKSKKSLEQLGAELKVSGGIVTKASLNSSFNLLKSNSEVEIHAFYYGGSTESAAKAIRQSIEDGKPGNIATYIEGQPYDHTLAMPVGYELKNLQNQRVGMGSNFEKLIETCVPWKSDILKLKVTLTDIQCIVTADGDNIADYGIRQHVYYKANRKAKVPFSTNFTIHGGDCALGNDVYWDYATALMCGGSKKQLHVTKGNSRMGNINNSVVYHITRDEYNDKNAEFILETWVKEYNGSGNDLVLNDDPSQSRVAIKDVLDILSGNKNLEATSLFKADGGVAPGIKFDYFDGMKLPLTQVKGTSKIILEGVIRARNKGSKLTDKAAVWVRFELID